MFEANVRTILEERLSLNDNDEPKIELSRNRLIEILSENLDDTIKFLNNCTKVELLYVSEVFEEIALNLQSVEYIETLYALDKKFSDLNLRKIIDIANSYMG